MKLTYQDILLLKDFVFRTCRSIDKITVLRALADDGFPIKSIKNDFHIVLPNSSDELDKRLSKKGRYNIKREKRIVADTFGACLLTHISANDTKAISVTDRFFEFKKETMGSDYGMKAETYLNNWYVTDIYYLSFGERIASILMSCEQCENVYLENITYDAELANYSPGQIAYDYYLKELIKKNKKMVYLLGGDYDYKKRYGSVETKVAELTYVRKNIKSFIKVYGKQFLIVIFNIMPQPVKNIYLMRK